MCAFMVARGILEYLEFDVVTKVGYFNEVPAEFPTITICSINSYEKNDPVFENESKKSLGPNIDEILIYCAFNRNNCLPRNFSRYYMYFYGNCFQFNSGKDYDGNNISLQKVYREGRWSGLTMELFLNENKEFPVNSFDNGYKIFITNKSSLINTFSKGILAQPGSSLQITLHKVITEKLPSPYSECQNEYPNDPIYSMYKSNGIIYKERDCVQLCLQKQIVQKCGCFDPIFDIFDENMRPCFNQSQLECSKFFFAILYETGKDEICSNLCKPECSLISYDISLSTSKYPTNKYCEILKSSDIIITNFAREGVSRENISGELIESRVLSISIYLGNLYYKKISEINKMNMPDLIANIGIITFVDIIELFTD
jgi:hypothetical protein